ncbi:MAG TPA: ribulose 1,5-bisphosphate carboxylase large subunit [Nitrospiraceae bacterium]|jgi:ribulose-bisphosphate carboxylase large chain|nr:ribulose 1,5-bisphosphate carboxylase large subunit [Nitrospiraceae bacterium]
MGFDGKSISVIYLIASAPGAIEAIAEDIALEQTVEVPKSVLRDPWITRDIVGRVTSIRKTDGQVGDCFVVTIDYPARVSNFEIPQFLNLLYGNISFKPGIKIIDIDFPKEFVIVFKGPKFGIEGIRALLNVYDRPLIATALKPMGMSAEQLGELCYQFALGGIHIIKDDHSLVDFPFCRFEERVTMCLRAIQKAEQKTGKRTLYFPNVTDRFDRIMRNIEFALKGNVGGLLISPFLTGLDCVRHISESEWICKPLMSHPSLSGGFFVNGKSGVSPDIILGKIFRLIGVDCSVYPNFGGRFSFDQNTCLAIANSLRDSFFHLKRSFPTPAGGINLKNVSDVINIYGKDIILLIGGSLYARSDNLQENARYFYEASSKVGHEFE